ncbi:lysophospholipid acyltransferase family protein [Teichococcus oryzae]|uniref:1-acyl-sn-glycerol-3-phosphate acyltransferase n=1 Tax=Teichococcus oryzae TaxID=1608942 RepID=A0A5B2TD25_9PROT|nr:1-acyl-sn-glycerol-3-phosphate acyltransferase [Pseudoroseomonas oryzae]KAA2212412.1 1-acyl-sn-glycerol-3-phosphate acyltransferase [Pseudoroseomonas oryzae]
MGSGLLSRHALPGPPVPLDGSAPGQPERLRPLLRATTRLIAVIAWTLLCIPVQFVLLLLPGRGRTVLPRLYHRVLCRLIGLRVRVVGEASHARPALFVSNHASWLDILVLGGVLEAAFVSKAEVGQWPLIRTVARLGQTVFVSRSRGRTSQEAQAMRQRLEEGGSLILFPEGTSNDGTRVLPFRSAFLGLADAAAAVQPVSVAYDGLGGLPARRCDRPLFAWYGDMEIGSHFWQLARLPGGSVTVLLHEPVAPGAFANRKDLTSAVERTVVHGAAALRQHRPATPASTQPGRGGLAFS